MNTVVNASTSLKNAPEQYKKQSQSVQIMIRLLHNPTAVIGLSILAVFILLGIFAPLLTPYDPAVIQPKEAFALYSREHLLGCDNFGRDQLTRLLYGARYSLFLGFSAAAVSSVIGIVLGVLAGYCGGWIDGLIMRFLDVLQAIPGILLSICISVALGAGYLNTIIALSIGGFGGIARMLRAKILSERTAEYLEAASSINCSTFRIMFKHLLPNTISPVFVNIAMGIGSTIMQAASLSYIGLGVPVKTPEWGAMLAYSRSFVQSYPHLLIWPGLFIAVTVLAANFLGDGLRDAMDPRLKS